MAKWMIFDTETKGKHYYYAKTASQAKKKYLDDAGGDIGDRKYLMEHVIKAYKQYGLKKVI